MTNQNTAASKKPGFPIKWWLLAGLVAGTLDATAASLSYFIRTGNKPARVWKFVASGVFGKSASTGGNKMVIAGLCFHYLIAFLFATFFFLIYPHLKFPSKNIVVTGLLYGIFVWGVMAFIVVPMSNTVQLPFNLKSAIIGALILMFCVGLPIALFAKKAGSRR
jgi:hypothetical protein